MRELRRTKAKQKGSAILKDLSSHKNTEDNI
jgi:hypothetical protein